MLTTNNSQKENLDPNRDANLYNLLNSEYDLIEDDKINNIKLFVGGLNYITMRADLKSYFETYAKVTRCIVMYNSDGKSKGFGFITLHMDEDKIISVKEKILKRRHEINGKLVDVKLCCENEKEKLLKSNEVQFCHYKNFQQQNLLRLQKEKNLNFIHNYNNLNPYTWYNYFSNAFNLNYASEKLNTNEELLYIDKKRDRSTSKKKSKNPNI